MGPYRVKVARAATNANPQPSFRVSHSPRHGSRTVNGHTQPITAPVQDEDHAMDDQIRHYENKLAYEIDSWDLKVAMESGENVVVVDTRTSETYDTRHIPGAINLPHAKMDESSTSVIDKTSLIVTYCDGIGCNGSTKGALKMARLGFRVRELIGGLDWWVRDGHPTHCNGGNSDACGCG